MSLRDPEGKQGLVSGQYALHSGRIGGATRLAAGEVDNRNPMSTEVEERRLYDLCKGDKRRRGERLKF